MAPESPKPPSSIILPGDEAPRPSGSLITSSGGHDHHGHSHPHAPNRPAQWHPKHDPAVPGIVGAPHPNSPAARAAREAAANGPRMDSNGVVDADSFKIMQDATAFMALKSKVEKRVGQWARGEVDSTRVRRELEREYQRMLHKKRMPHAPNIAGAVELEIFWKEAKDHVVSIFWDWIPTPTGPMCVGVCPKCFMSAPMSVDANKRTRPTLFEEQLYFLKGDPEADAKLVTFKLQSPVFHIYKDERHRLTVREIVRCPSGRHGKDQKAIRRCDWAVRIEDGIASAVTHRGVLKPGESRGITGPLVLVK